MAEIKKLSKVSGNGEVVKAHPSTAKLSDNKGGTGGSQVHRYDKAPGGRK